MEGVKIICVLCGKEEDKRKHNAICKDCSNTKQRLARLANSNKNIKTYAKTKKGFLVRLYRNMKSRIEGIQKLKFHLYVGKELLEKSVFYDWSLNNSTFLELFKNWENSEYDTKLTPSVDRIDSNLGYKIDNMEWVTHSENSRRGAISKSIKNGEC